VKKGKSFFFTTPCLRLAGAGKTQRHEVFTIFHSVFCWILAVNNFPRKQHVCLFFLLICKPHFSVFGNHFQLVTICNRFTFSAPGKNNRPVQNGKQFICQSAMLTDKRVILSIVYPLFFGNFFIFLIINFTRHSVNDAGPHSPILNPTRFESHFGKSPNKKSLIVTALYKYIRIYLYTFLPAVT
jgi:hypothetical protein